MSQSNRPKSNYELSLEVQELRQFCVQLILGLRERGLTSEQCDHWWEKLGSYKEVSKGLPVCCGGGPQWGHDWNCEKLP